MEKVRQWCGQRSDRGVRGRLKSRTERMHRMQRCCYRCSVVYVSVCLLDTNTSCAKTAEPIEMQFGKWTQVGRRNYVLGGGPHSPGNEQFWGHLPAHYEVQEIFGVSQRYATWQQRCGLSQLVTLF